MSDYVVFLDKQKGGQMKKILASEYKEERMVQDLIKTYTTLLPSIFSSRIVTLTDEYATDVGSIDILCVDDNGRIYLIETKLQNNADRRTVIAQLIDYATQLGKESFELFKSKIEKKTGKTLEEILGVFGEDSIPENLDNIKQSLKEKNFVLIVAMDRIERKLKDAIIFLNQRYEMDVFGLELRKHILEDCGAVFVPIVTPPPDIPRPTQPRKFPISFNELVESYSRNGLATEIVKIQNAFEIVKEKGGAQIRYTPSYVILEIGNGEIQIWLNKDPEKSDHGTWVYNPQLYDKVFELGQRLGLQVNMSSSQNFAKIIQFNGEEGIKQVSSVIQDLVDGLLEI